MDVPKVIRLVREGKQFSMTVDGEEFPYPICEDDIEISVAPLRSGMVRLTLLADRVEIVNDFNGPAEEPVVSLEEPPISAAYP